MNSEVPLGPAQTREPGPRTQLLWTEADQIWERYQNEREFRVLGEPEWVYRKREAEIPASATIMSVLRNSGSENDDD